MNECRVFLVQSFTVIIFNITVSILTEFHSALILFLGFLLSFYLRISSKDSISPIIRKIEVTVSGVSFWVAFTHLAGIVNFKYKDILDY